MLGKGVFGRCPGRTMAAASETASDAFGGWRMRRTYLPFLLIGLAILVIAIDDASFLGGVRPFDGGDDGLFYDGVGAHHPAETFGRRYLGRARRRREGLLLRRPGLRYFRALEHIVFGETYLGYLSLIFLLPIVVQKVFRRFLPERWSLALVLLFVAVPVGVLFGTSFLQYVKWASRGFADPAAYMFFIFALLPIVGFTSAGPGGRILPAFFGALLLAIAVFMKPIVAPAAAILLGGAGLAALTQRQWPRLTGLCIGFLPVLGMPLHNWVFGHAMVLFSTNANDPHLLVMPPSAYLAAARDLLSLDFSGIGRVFVQIANWLSGRRNPTGRSRSTPPASPFWSMS